VYVGRDFPPAEQTESDVYGLDFINDLDVGEQIVSSTWYLTVTDGTDPNPQFHLQGPSKLYTTDDNTMPTATIQRIGGLWAGVTYKARAEVTTDFGNIKSLWSHIHGVDAT